MNAEFTIKLTRQLSHKQEEVLAAELLSWLARRGHRQFCVGIWDSVSGRVPRLTIGVKGQPGVALNKEDYWDEKRPGSSDRA